MNTCIRKHKPIYFFNNPVKKYLSSGRQAETGIASKTGQINRLRREALSIPELESDIEFLRKRHTEIKRHLKSFTDNVIFQQVLEMRYIERLRLYTIANRLGLSKEQCNRAHKKALSAFEKYLTENEIK